jgi:adenylate cyclase
MANSSFSHPRLRHALLAGASTSAVMALLAFTPALEKLETLSVDFRQQKFANLDREPASELIHIDIDEESLKILEKAYGRWPWPRSAYRSALEFLSKGEPKMILFDILFTEPQAGHDQELAEISKALGNVSHSALLFEKPLIEGEPTPLTELDVERSAIHWRTQWLVDPLPNLDRYEDINFSLSELRDRLPTFHSVKFPLDSDGMARRAPLLFRYKDLWLPSLSLQSVLSQVELPMLDLRPGYLDIYENKRHTDPSRSSLAEQDILRFSIPIDEKGQLRLNYYPLKSSYESKEKVRRVYSFAEVIDSAQKLESGSVEDPAQLKVNPEHLSGKTILIGTSATALHDLKNIPGVPDYPGVLLHDTVASNILKSDYLRFTPSSLTWTALLAAPLLGSFLTLLPQAFALQILLPLLLWLFGSAMVVHQFHSHSLVLSWIGPSLGLLFAYIEGLGYLTFVEGRQKRQLQGTLTKYLPPSMVAELIASGKNPHAEVGQRRELSILFSDIRGFTTLSERLPAERIVQKLNEYLERMTDVIFENRGTLDKFIGDAVMSFWGAPLEQKDHAILSIRTGLQMASALQTLRQDWEKSGDPFPIEIGVGINSGEVIVGNIGSEKRLDYTVIGDNVNLASRLEGLTKQYHLAFLVGEKTYELAREHFVFRKIDLVAVKGKEKPVGIFEPLAEVNSAHSAEALQKANAFQLCWETYFKGDFAQALTQFESFLTVYPGDGAGLAYVERCQELKESNPPLWDGIYRATSK